MSAAPRTGLLIFSRLNSSRLPGKALLKIGETPLLAHVIRRARRVRTEAGGPFSVVVATTDRAGDDPIAALAEAEGAEVFRGDYEDVAKRLRDCAVHFGFEVVSRICGDSPFVDWKLMSWMIAERARRQVEIATNILPRSCPSGNAMEILTTAAMERVLALTSDPEDREHPTRYIYNHPDAFDLWNHFVPPEEFAGVRLAIDTPADLEQANWIVSRLSVEPVEASYETIAALSREWSRQAEARTSKAG